MVMLLELKEMSNMHEVFFSCLTSDDECFLKLKIRQVIG